LICPSQKLLAQLMDRGAQLGWREACVVACQLLQPGLDRLGADGGGGLWSFGWHGWKLSVAEWRQLIVRNRTIICSIRHLSDGCGFRVTLQINGGTFLIFGQDQWLRSEFEAALA
jgi:hypothetical protein